MVRVCAWCERYLGSMEPLRDPGVSHGICDDCFQRQAAEAPVLVVSRERLGAVPMIQSMLRGAPDVQLVVDRRVAVDADRPAADRRRSTSFYVV